MSSKRPVTIPKSYSVRGGGGGGGGSILHITISKITDSVPVALKGTSFIIK